MLNIIEQYSHADRHFHNFNHIASMLEKSKHFNLTARENIQLRLAILYHDYVHNPTSSTNEQDSAEVFMQDLMAKKIYYNINYISMSELGASVMMMIQDSIDHTPRTQLSKYLIDLDLWDLAADIEKYNKNKKLLRYEYMMYSDESFNSGRKKWIQKMLDKTQIYNTDYCIENGFEDKARNNLRTELNNMENKYVNSYTCNN